MQHKRTGKAGTATEHPIDNSALIHLAVHNKWHSNVFRLECHLKNAVCPARLQQAVDAVAVRFPMLAAGIQKRGNGFVVVPCPEDLNIRVDSQPLLYMSREEIRDCAMRVLYGPHHIALEFFHSLTDGCGGVQFLKGLLAEYFGVPMQPLPIKEAWEDSYQKYAARGTPTSMPGGVSYLLPAAPPENSPVHRTTLTFSVDELRARAKAEHTTLTAWFTALFAQTAVQLQYQNITPDRPLQPVQIMIPIDLRKRFPSASCRNFSLYALPKLTLDAAKGSFSEIAESMEVQIQAQSSYERLQSAIATNVALERKTSALPLWIKCAALRKGFEICGGRSSCITLSNLGQVTFPDPIQREIERLDFLLTPRAHSPYNCSMISVGNTLSLTITRRGPEKGFEKIFLQYCAEIKTVEIQSESKSNLQ
ncbi:hypothetical protein [Faecalibacterium prausnitzii]|uniref:hypothetical protein n=1 Tax=Faecalibacterium prausnitzii TaxID=853 RepID=UPI0012DD9F3D|nr:hypothetical protein [Faecalibacterium prausnitzii]